jgi:pimeloyl-ACP methyl ester carboxylesterase
VPEIRVNGVTLQYDERGAGASIVGVHGTGSSALAWTDAARSLSTRGRVIVYDRRGCLRSERPDAYATDVPQQADDAAALIEALDAAPAIVIGRSYGADIAIELVLRRPELVRALVLLEGVESMTEQGRQWLAELTSLVLATAETRPAAVAETLFRYVVGKGGWESLPEAAQAMFVANGPAIVAELRGGGLEVSVEQLATIARPTLLLSGLASSPVYTEATRLIAAAIPGARVEWVEGGHVLDPAHPSVLAFLDEVVVDAAHDARM